MPPPEPRSSTTSPGFSSASAVGLPQPSEARQSFLRDLTDLAGVVQIGSDGIAAGRRRRRPAAGTAPRGHAQRSLAILLLYDFLDIRGLSSAHEKLLFADLYDSLWLYGFVPSATFGIEELQQFLQGFSVGGVAQKRAFALHVDQALGFQLLQMMGEGRVGNLQFLLNFADYQSVGVSGKQQAHDAQTGLGTDGGEHVGIGRNALAGVSGKRGSIRHISIILEIWILSSNFLPHTICMVNLALRQELVAMREEDLRVRKELVDAGELGGPYVPRMEAVHVRNAARLRELIAEHGWPTEEIAGKDGAEAAWFITQHAIGEPDFQRSVLKLLQSAAGKVPAWHAAYLEDRIAMQEGRPQRFGSQWMDDPRDGFIRPWRLAEPENVNSLRASVGLDPLRPIPEPGPELSDEEQRRVKENQRWWEEWLASKGWR